MTEPLDAMASDYSIPQPTPKPLGDPYVGLCDLGCQHDAMWQMFEIPRPAAQALEAPRYVWNATCPRCDCDCADCTGWTFKAQLRRRLAA